MIFNWEINVGNILTAILILLALWKMAQGWRDKMEKAVGKIGMRVETLHSEAMGEIRDLGMKVARVEGLLNGERRAED